MIQVNGKPATALISAAPEDKIQKPQNAEKCLLVAYFLGLGWTQREAAKAAGVGDRTVRDWMGCSWWQSVEIAAHQKFMRRLTGRTKESLLNLVNGCEPATVRFAAERLLPELKPAEQTLNVRGELVWLLTKLPDEELDRLNDMDDTELRHAVRRLAAN